MAKGDATGWKRGAGSYSRSYAKVSPAGIGKLYADGRGHGEKERRPGKEIADRVEASQRATAPGSTSSVPTGGVSGEVSRGKRPSYRQGSWKRA